MKATGIVRRIEECVQWGKPLETRINTKVFAAMEVLWYLEADEKLAKLLRLYKIGSSWSGNALCGQKGLGSP